MGRCESGLSAPYERKRRRKVKKNEYTTFGVMLDVSRNAVMKVDQVKRMIDCLAKIGYNAVELYSAMSGYAYFWGHDFEVLHLKGAWVRERHIVRNPLGMGAYRIESQRGASGHEQNPFLALARPHTTEFSGDERHQRRIDKLMALEK